jgi:hypothetical protein
VRRWEQKQAKVGVVLHPAANVVNAGDDTATLLDKRRAYKDPRQVEFEFWNGLQTMAKKRGDGEALASASAPASAQAGGKPGAGPGRLPITELGKLKIVTASQVVKKQCLEYGSAAAINLPAATAEDIGQIATMFWRNASMEPRRTNPASRACPL